MIHGWTGHRGPHHVWGMARLGTEDLLCVGHGWTGHRGPVVRGAWLDWAQGPILHMAPTRRAAGLTGLQAWGTSSTGRVRDRGSGTLSRFGRVRTSQEG